MQIWLSKRLCPKPHMKKIEEKKEKGEVCPAKLDKFLYDNGTKDPTKTQHCCVSTILSHGRSAESTKKILVDVYKFQNVKEPQVLPCMTPLKEKKKKQFGNLSPGPVTCDRCGEKPGFRDPASGFYHQFCSQKCKEKRSGERS